MAHPSEEKINYNPLRNCTEDFFYTNKQIEMLKFNF